MSFFHKAQASGPWDSNSKPWLFLPRSLSHFPKLSPGPRAAHGLPKSEQPLTRQDLGRGEGGQAGLTVSPSSSTPVYLTPAQPLIYS